MAEYGAEKTDDEIFGDPWQTVLAGAFPKSFLKISKFSFRV
jgi:hypothetical protein